MYIGNPTPKVLKKLKLAEHKRQIKEDRRIRKVLKELGITPTMTEIAKLRIHED
jgi:hypothetical protein